MVSPPRGTALSSGLAQRLVYTVAKEMADVARRPHSPAGAPGLQHHAVGKVLTTDHVGGVNKGADLVEQQAVKSLESAMKSQLPVELRHGLGFLGELLRNDSRGTARTGIGKNRLGRCRLRRATHCIDTH